MTGTSLHVVVLMLTTINEISKEDINPFTVSPFKYCTELNLKDGGVSKCRDIPDFAWEAVTHKREEWHSSCRTARLRCFPLKIRDVAINKLYCFTKLRLCYTPCLMRNSHHLSFKSEPPIQSMNGLHRSCDPSRCALSYFLMFLLLS